MLFLEGTEVPGRDLYVVGGREETVSTEETTAELLLLLGPHSKGPSAVRGVVANGYGNGGF